MTLFRYTARALALSLMLGASGAFCMVGPAPVAVAVSTSNPVGGAQLAQQGVIVNLRPGVAPPPPMAGGSYLVADMDTGQILLAKSPHSPHLPASTLKALTALTLIPILDPDAKVLVKQADVSIDGTHVGIVAGRTYSVRMLMQGLLMASGNDAAYALAREDHSVAETLRQMNATAALLGASDTVARDPSGLDKAGQQSSAYDLALIGRAAMKLPDFRRYVTTQRASVPGGTTLDGKVTPGFQISNHNTLLYNYPGAIGIKNGYTIAAKSNYIEAATRGGKTYLLTQMDSPVNSWRPMAALLDWAFAHGSSMDPIGQLVEPARPIAPTVAATPQPAVAETAAADALRGASAVSSSPASAHGPAPTGILAAAAALLLLAGAWGWRSISRSRR